MISGEEQTRLASVIGDVEDETSGEIVLVIAEQAGHYRAVPLLWAMLAALVTPWPLIWLTDISTSRIFLIQLGVALVLSLVPWCRAPSSTLRRTRPPHANSCGVDSPARGRRPGC